ncbi:ABC transporter permease [Streptomyces brasiliensis]|uniref:ABC transporter permease n=1 Tax=Streptomyces brasiliensis TaxID=1954 RepID=A0A917UNP8_9ACTN|nr:ABC transporter permease [Streptomyces brasiliensis]GGJ71289.1 ABC transporter permease [Streptomyces brasiliensis]
MSNVTTEDVQAAGGSTVMVPRPPAAAAHRIGSFVDSRLTGLVLKRTATAIVLLMVVSVLSFVLISLTPGDEARAIVGLGGTHEQYLHVRAELGLDKSPPEQYWQWLTRAVHGNFGETLTTSEPVTSSIQTRLGVTISLTVGSMILSFVLGVLFGVISAVRGGVTGRLLDALGVLGFAVPSFWLAAVLITIFAVKLGWLPSTGYVSPSVSLGQWLQSLVLPVLALSIGGIAAIAKQARDGMLEALASEHIRAARASGVSPTSIIFRHALRGAALRVIAVTGWIAISLLGGAVFVESVFAIPGLGSLAVTAATQHDIPLIQGVVVCFTVIVVIVNLSTDVLYIWLDPRVRVA